MPAGHWVYDDLHQSRLEVFVAGHAQAQARERIAEGNTLLAAVVLGFMMNRDKAWLTAEERFEIYPLWINLLLREQHREEANKVFVQFAAEVQKHPLDDPMHESVQYWATKLQQVNDEED